MAIRDGGVRGPNGIGAAGTGDVTHTGTLTEDKIVIGNGGNDITVSAASCDELGNISNVGTIAANTFDGSGGTTNYFSRSGGKGWGTEGADQVYTDGTRTLTLKGPATVASSNKDVTFPDATGTVALLSLAQTWTADQSFGNVATIDITDSAPTMPNITTGTDTYFLTLDAGNVVRKEAVGVSAGPLSGIESITVENGLVTDITGAECPYVDIFVGGEQIRVGEVIPNRNSREKSGVDLLALPVMVAAVRLSEEKPETSYISRIRLVVSLLGGGFSVLKPKDPILGENIVMNTGDVLDIEFPSLPHNAVGCALLSEGYYITKEKSHGTSV